MTLKQLIYTLLTRIAASYVIPAQALSLPRPIKFQNCTFCNHEHIIQTHCSHLRHPRVCGDPRLFINPIIFYLIETIFFWIPAYARMTCQSALFYVLVIPKNWGNDKTQAGIQAYLSLLNENNIFSGPPRKRGRHNKVKFAWIKRSNYYQTRRLILLTLTFIIMATNLTAHSHKKLEPLKQYFKKATKKPARGTQGLTGVDFIYMINLDQRPEKFASCIAQLHPFGIHPYRFSAVNGWELSLDTFNNIGVIFDPTTITEELWGTYFDIDSNGSLQQRHELMCEKNRVYFHTTLLTEKTETSYPLFNSVSPGSIGIILSHLSILQDAYNAHYKRIWVMEDDIEVIKQPHLITAAIKKLNKLVGPDGWDILFTDKDTKNSIGDYVPCYIHAPRPNFVPTNPEKFAKRTPIGNDFIKIGARYGAYSMIIQRSGIKKLLDFFETYRVFLPYDMDFYLPEDINMFTVINDIVSTQPKALSDNAKPGYQENSNNQQNHG